ncbi:MAG TPA: hydrogenase maturation protease [Thermoanaerobaculia bacterium]|nr:hydrogenase maturation protease [Thermoanaerobaculia bacterium]
MSFELAQKVADAVLYEGYVLYPYRASAGKNRIRWQFGCVVPAGYAELGGSEPAAMQTECLIEPAGADVSLDLRVRFLQVQARTIEERSADDTFRPVETLEVGDRMLVTWEEGVERRFDATAIPLAELLAGERKIAIELPAGREIEEARGEDGRVVARIVRERWPISGVVRMTAERQAGLIKLRVRIENLDGWKESADREQALRRSMIGAHTLLAARGGAFVSLLDPPAAAAAAVAACENLHTWPVLIGPEDSRDVVLSSPIILYDHPAVAAESEDDFCDATEIDEILTLRVMTLTEDEKREARGTDERSRRIIERSDASSPELLERLHGVVRPLGAEPAPVAEDSARTAGTLAELAEWETFLNPPGVVPPEEAEIEVSGVVLSQGSRVRLRPTRRADSMDLFLAGRVARVEGVYRDVEDVAWVAVSLDGDPASDLHSSHGRFFYFYPDEVEPLATDSGELDAERRTYETSDSGRAGLDGDLGHHPVAAGPGALHENLADVAASGGTLIACVGNIFLGDDGFGVEVARQLAMRELPEGVRAVDYGIRGVHLAYELADKSYETVILVDATPRGGTPGTVYLIEPDLDRLGEVGAGAADAHGMDPQTVFALLRTLGGKPGRVLIVGCEPASTDDEIALSEPVAAAVDEAVKLIFELVERGDPAALEPVAKEESV